MGTVTKLNTGRQGTTPAAAADAFLRTKSGGTLRVYTVILRAFAGRFAGATDIGDISPDEFAEWFTARWGERSASRWNTCLEAIKSACGYWERQGWLAADMTVRLEHRRVPEDRDRALSRAEVEQLLTDDRHPLRDRLLWRMLYETAARSAEVLALDVEDLDMPNRRARVRRKGGAQDVIVWQTATARLLPRYLKGRTSGPLFVTERRARVELPPCDIDPGTGRARLSYSQAEDLFKKASGGRTLHQLRHSALSHDAEDGTSTPMLMARSGHTSVRSLAKYARVSAEALAAHQAATDPARRR